MGNTKEKIPARNLNIVTREERRGCGMLFDTDTGRVYGLNPVALLVWKLENIVHRVVSASCGHTARKATTT